MILNISYDENDFFLNIVWNTNRYFFQASSNQNILIWNTTDRKLNIIAHQVWHMNQLNTILFQFFIQSLLIVQTSSRAYPASSPAVTRGNVPGVTWWGCNADHLPPPSDKVKKGGAITPLSHMSSWHYCLIH